MGHYISDKLGDKIIAFLAEQGFAAKQDTQRDVDIFSLDHSLLPEGMSSDLEFHARFCTGREFEAEVGDDHDCCKPDYVLGVHADFDNCEVDDEVFGRHVETDSVEELQPLLGDFITQCSSYCSSLHEEGALLAIKYSHLIRRLEAVTKSSWSRGEASQVSSFFYVPVQCPHRVDLVRPVLETFAEYLTELKGESK